MISRLVDHDPGWVVVAKRDKSIARLDALLNTTDVLCANPKPFFKKFQYLYPLATTALVTAMIAKHDYSDFFCARTYNTFFIVGRFSVIFFLSRPDILF